MSSLPSPTLPSLEGTFGALFIGATIAAVLFGIMNLQVLIYYKRYPKDWSLYLYSVALFWVLDSIHFALGTHALYYYLIDMYGNFLGALLENAIWSMRLQLLFKVWIIVLVQGIYAIRLSKLGRHFHKILPWFVFIAIAVSFGNSIALRSSSITVFMPPRCLQVLGYSCLMRCKKPFLAACFARDNSLQLYYSEFGHRLYHPATQISIYIFYSVAITTDFTIAFMMCYYLHKSRAIIHLPFTAHKLLGLMRLALVSGLATSDNISACSLFALFTYLAWSDTLIFVAIDFILPKLYINSLLAMLNYRQQSSKRTTSECIAHPISADLQFASNLPEAHTTEMDITLSLSDIQDVHSSHHHNDSKGTVVS
ncbi:hypothetical protein IW261DRAFT_1559000 [Armillaria novae-zelandiae]|uniref:DUF6534 domain-containing protein n=1 Tax=Armillaria novae-zelandiae TaxID=153914 RepID=A0AA39PQI8_9AGAR|nr:hypothetical protein IW261DRAFT_1559000 [Armillaria novae-zelandiae]